jgi:sterol 3beta-glucosyltransferase
MNIHIITVGTRGDVQPYVALGGGLRAAGHRVTVVTSAQFGALITANGLYHAPLAADFLALVDTPEGKAALAGKNPLGALRRVRPMIRALLDQIWAASQDAELIVYHPKALAPYHVAEKLGVPAILAHPVPFASPTAAFPTPVLPLPNLGGWLNRRSYGLLLWAAGAGTSGIVRQWRREVLGLPPARDELHLHNRPIPKLYAFSPHVLPPPPDWDASTYVTGYWFLKQARDWTPPPELAEFLDAGPAPVYVGFGSMAAADAAANSAIVAETLRRAGTRGIVATGAGGLDASIASKQVLVLDSVPHDWLFPRVAAVVHHGGAGTTAAAVRAGVAQVICPFFGDQPFWGRRMQALGVAPAPIAQRRLTTARLHAALGTALGTAAREHAERLGAAVRAEDGVGSAVTLIERLIERPATLLDTA